jgi:hypothetical protein
MTVDKPEVMFYLENRDTESGSVTLRLKFQDPKNISQGTVRNCQSVLIIEIGAGQYSSHISRRSFCQNRH